MNSLPLCAAVLGLALAACSTTTQRPGSTTPVASKPAPTTSTPAPAVAPAPTAPAPETTAAAPMPAPVTPAAPVSNATATPAPAPVPTAKKKEVAVVKPAAAPAQPKTPAAAGEAHAKPSVAATPAIPAIAPGAVSLHGHIDLTASGDQKTTPADLADTTIYFVPDAGAPAPKPGRFKIYTREKHFDPETLVIPVGSTIGFPNQDEILHNVFSISPAGSFDLGLYGEGGSADYTFKKAGIVLINCNVHQAMQANVLVLDTPYFVHPGADGDFDLKGVPAGPGKLMVWHPRGAIQTNAVVMPAAAPIALHLALIRPRVVQHLNKENKPY